MKTILWNPQVTSFVTDDDGSDEFIAQWGEGTLGDLNVADLQTTGGSNIKLNTTTATAVSLTGGSAITLLNTTPALTLNSLTVDGGSKLTSFAFLNLAGNVTIDNGSTITANGGLSLSSDLLNAIIKGGSTLIVNGSFFVDGNLVKQVGDISYIWKTDVHSGSRVFHQAEPVPCFLQGSLILTGWDEDGIGLYAAVEDLQVGDTVVTPYGTDTISWIGSYEKHFTHEEKREALRKPDLMGVPVRLFGTLGLTPEHCLVIEETLVPVRLLVDGVNILWDFEVFDRGYTAYHFTLTDKSHAPVYMYTRKLALAVESFLNNGHADWIKERQLKGLTLPPSHENVPPVHPVNTSSENLEKAWDILGLTQLPKADSDVQLDLHAIAQDGTRVNVSSVVWSDELVTQTFETTAENPITALAFNTVRPSDIPGLLVDDRRELGFRGNIIAIDSNGHNCAVGVVVTAGVTPDGWAVDGHVALTLPKNAAGLKVEIVQSYCVN